LDRHLRGTFPGLDAPTTDTQKGRTVPRPLTIPQFLFRIVSDRKTGKGICSIEHKYLNVERLARRPHRGYVIAVSDVQPARQQAFRQSVPMGHASKQDANKVTGAL
jgi:hypothetical protein